MEDQEIIKLFYDRDEHAITGFESKYGKLIMSVASGILCNAEDAKDCSNEVLLKLWNSIPPADPSNLAAFAVKITRNLALDMISFKKAKKRQNESVSEAYEELSEMLASDFDLEKEIEKKELEGIINTFVKKLGPDERHVFVGRFFYFESLENISKKTGLSVKKVRNTIKKCREKLAEVLIKEGYYED